MAAAAGTSQHCLKAAYSSALFTPGVGRRWHCVLAADGVAVLFSLVSACLCVQAPQCQLTGVLPSCW